MHFPLPVFFFFFSPSLCPLSLIALASLPFLTVEFSPCVLFYPFLLISTPVFFLLIFIRHCSVPSYHRIISLFFFFTLYFRFLSHPFLQHHYFPHLSFFLCMFSSSLCYFLPSVHFLISLIASISLLAARVRKGKGERNGGWREEGGGREEGGREAGVAREKMTTNVL